MANLIFLTCIFFIGEFSFTFAKPETQFRSKFVKLWPNGEIPITFDSHISDAEQGVLWQVAARFNKDMNGCVSIM